MSTNLVIHYMVVISLIFSSVANAATGNLQADQQDTQSKNNSLILNTNNDLLSSIDTTHLLVLQPNQEETPQVKQNPAITTESRIDNKMATDSFISKINSELKDPFPLLEKDEVRTRERTLKNLDGDTLTFKTHVLLNAEGNKEVIYELIESRFYLPNLKVKVLYGRDLNHDQRIDAWFINSHAGIVDSIDSSKHVALEEDGWDVAQDILINKIKISNRSIFRLAYSGVTGIVYPMQSMYTDNYIDNLTRTTLYLYELEIRANRLMDANLKSHEASEYFQQLSHAWMDLDKDIRNHVYRDRIVAALGDVALFAALAGLGKGATFLAGRISSIFGETSAGRLIVLMYEKTVSRVLLSCESAMARIQPKLALAKSLLPRGAVKSLAVAKLVAEKLTPTQYVKKFVFELSHRSRSSRVLAKAILKSYALSARSSAVVSGAFFEKIEYISLVQSLQLAIEVNQRHLFSWNPVVLFKNIKGDKDLLQNFAFMTAETTQGAVVNSLKKDSAWKAMKISGVISMADTSAVNMLMKDNIDKKRVAVDMGWQVIPGNILTTIDMKALERFSDYARIYKNPRLKLIGWAIVLIDQGINMGGYNKAVSIQENRKKKNMTPEKESLIRGNNLLQRIEIAPVYVPQT